MSEKINITKDSMKAEAKIRRMRNSAEVSAKRAEWKRMRLESEYIATLTPEVRAVLIAAGVLSAPESHTTGEWIDIADTVPEEAEALS